MSATKSKWERTNKPQPTAPVVHPTAIYTRQEVAKLLRCSTRRVSDLVKANEIRAKKEGTKLLILGEAILAYLRRPEPAAMAEGG